MPTAPTEIRKWLLNVGWQVGFAVALAAAFAVGSGGTPAAFFRYVAAICGLTSVLQAIVAVGRGRALGCRLSEWDEAFALGAVTAFAHLIAERLAGAT